MLLSRDDARRYLTSHLGLAVDRHPPGAEGVRALLRHLRCIQLDPLDKVGTNADLVAMARVHGLKRGDVYSHLMPGHAFEHWAKERCLLPLSAFAWYRSQTRVNGWFRVAPRLERLPEGTLQAVLDQLRERGPLTPAEIDLGSVRPVWEGEVWQGTKRASAMALEVLWVRCEVVIVERTPGGKRYDLPERVVPDEAHPEQHFDAWALTERVEAAGLLPTAAGPWWGLLHERRRAVTRELVARGALLEVRIEGSQRTWLAPPDLADRAPDEPDDRMRVLGPLDPLLWDRKLVQQVFDFEYVWEVYKPKAQRKWGYYVCPLLHRGRLVGRFEGHRDDRGVVVDALWKEPGVPFDDAAFDEAIARLGAAQ